MCLYTLRKVKSLEAFVTYYHAFPKGSIIKKPTYTYWKSWHGPLTSERKTSCWLCNRYATVKKKKKALSKVQNFLQVNKGHLEGWNVMRYLENYRKKRHLDCLEKISDILHMQLLHSPDCGSSFVQTTYLLGHLNYTFQIFASLDMGSSGWKKALLFWGQLPWQTQVLINIIGFFRNLPWGQRNSTWIVLVLCGVQHRPSLQRPQ